MTRGIKKYFDFHQQEPVKIGTMSVVIPDRAIYVGRANHVLYRSDKLNPTTLEDEGWIDYIHKHDRGVNTFRCDRGSEQLGTERTVPAYIRNAQELVWLGFCLGFEYKDHEGKDVEARGSKPLPELWTTSNGRALLVIQNKRTLIAMMWGGRLGVEPRGIVH